MNPNQENKGIPVDQPTAESGQQGAESKIQVTGSQLPVASEQPEARSQNPAASSQQPTTDSQKPIAESEQQTTNNTQGFIPMGGTDSVNQSSNVEDNKETMLQENKNQVAGSQLPVASEQPKVDSGQPVASSQQPAVTNPLPVLNTNPVKKENEVKEMGEKKDSTKRILIIIIVIFGILLLIAGLAIGYLVAQNEDLFGGSSSSTQEIIGQQPDEAGSNEELSNETKDYTQEEAVAFNNEVVESQKEIVGFINEFYSDQVNQDVETANEALQQNASRADGILNQFQNNADVKPDGQEFYDNSVRLFEFYRDLLANRLIDLVEILNNDEFSEEEKQAAYDDLTNDISIVEQRLFQNFADSQDEFAEVYGIELTDETEEEGSGVLE